MEPLPAPSAQIAEHCTRQVCFSEALPAAVISPTAGQSPRRLATLQTVELFLQRVDDKSPQNIKDTVNFVNPKGLAEWVEQTLGDTDLGRRLKVIANDGRAYGFLVPDLKREISERLAQYEAALATAKAS